MTVKHPLQRFIENDLHSNISEVAGKLNLFTKDEITQWIADNKLIGDLPIEFKRSLVALKADQTYSRTYSNLLGYQGAWLKDRDKYQGVLKENTENDYLSNEFQTTLLEQLRKDKRIKNLIVQERAEKKANGAISCILEFRGHATFKYTFFNLEMDPHLNYGDDKAYVSYYDRHQCLPFPKVNDSEYDKLSCNDKMDDLYDDEDNFYSLAIIVEKEYDMAKLILDITRKNNSNNESIKDSEDVKYHQVQHGLTRDDFLGN